MFGWLNKLCKVKEVEKIEETSNKGEHYNNFLNATGYRLTTVEADEPGLWSIEAVKTKEGLNDTLYQAAAKMCGTTLEHKSSSEADKYFFLNVCSHRVAQDTMRGNGNMVFLSDKDLFKELAEESPELFKGKYMFLLTDEIPKDQILVVYNGNNQLDKAFYLEGKRSIRCAYPTVRGVFI